MRKNVTKEVKEELKTESSISIRYQNEPTSSTIPKQPISCNSSSSSESSDQVIDTKRVHQS